MAPVVTSFPGLAGCRSAQEPRLADRPGWENPDGMEASLVPSRGYEMAWVRFGALRGKGVLRKLMLPVALLSGFWQAWREIRRVKPGRGAGHGRLHQFSPAG